MLDNYASTGGGGLATCILEDLICCRPVLVNLCYYVRMKWNHVSIGLLLKVDMSVIALSKNNHSLPQSKQAHRHITFHPDPGVCVHSAW